MDLSIVIPVYNEAEALGPLCDSLERALAGLSQTSEIVFADDGSTDGSATKLDQLAKLNSRIRVLHLRRNYGQTAAMMAAIQNSTGDIVISMDSDGQNDPADIPALLSKMAEGYDVVSGWRKKRDDRALTRRFPSLVANRLISMVFGVPLHDYGCTLKAYRRDVIEDVRLYGEMHRFIPVYAAWEGARVTEIPVTHHARRFGKSKYGLGRISRVLLDILVLYFINRAIDRPIQFFGKFGIASLVLSALVFSWALILKFVFGVYLIQTPLPLLAATIGLSGLLFLFLGVLAEIQSRTYFEARGKTAYKIRSIIQNGPEQPRPGDPSGG
jgi:glycosyltransferase involved in cell wall biosynthesis